MTTEIQQLEQKYQCDIMELRFGAVKQGNVWFEDRNRLWKLRYLVGDVSNFIDPITEDDLPF